MSDNPNPHPAHKEVLDLLPPEFHGRVTEVLKKWDKGVQDRFAEINEKYKPYESIIDNNVDPNFVAQALGLVEQIREDPAGVVKQINEAWSLGFVTADEVEQLRQQSSNDDSDLSDLDFGDDITKHPQFKAIQSQLEEVSNRLKSQDEEEAQERALAELEDYLDELEAKAEEDNLPFDRTYVTALMSQGFKGEEAVDKFRETLAGLSIKGDPQENTSTNSEPPVVMGGAGSAGSGLPDGSVKMGDLSRKETNDLVQQMLAKSFESGQG